MSTSTDIGSLIVRSPEIRGGRPRVAGTGVTVRRIVGWYQLGLNADEIAERIGHLTLAHVYAALAYYHANRDEIDADIAAEEALTEAVMKHTAIPEPPGFADLPRDEQVRYLQALWDRISEQPEEIPVPQSHLEVLEERLEELQSDRTRTRSAFEIIELLRKGR